MFDFLASDNARFGESLPQQIASHIIAEILKGDLRSGDKIVEEELSKKLRISRAPVREAIYLLQIAGIAEKLPRRGAIIKKFTSEEIKEYVEVLAGLVDLAFQFSRKKWESAEQLALLYACLEELNAAYEKKELAPYQKCAQRFLRCIIHAGDNKALNHFFEETTQVLIVFASVRWTKETMDEYHARMLSVAAALQALDFEQAKSLIREAALETLK